MPQKTFNLSQITIWSVMIISTLVAYMIRSDFISVVTYDTEAFFIPWVEYIRSHGGYLALKDPFASYTPAYLYLLVIANYIFPKGSALLVVKSITIFFDLIAAIVMYRLVALKYKNTILPGLAYCTVLFTPTILMNSSCWGQCDIIYATFILACVYYCCLESPLAAVLCYAMAFTMKLQAIFLGPFILMFLLKKKLLWKHILLIPGIYLISMLPCLFLGRSFSSLMDVYITQTQILNKLCLNASNPYYFIPDTYYTPALIIGILIAGGAGLFISISGSKNKHTLDRTGIILMALVSLALMPFLLPKMHDRYFLPAELISIALAFYEPCLWFIPFTYQIVASVVYVRYLSYATMMVPTAMAGSVLLHTMLVLFICYLFYKSIKTDPKKPESFLNFLKIAQS